MTLDEERFVPLDQRSNASPPRATIAWPPGNAGQVAQVIYQIAPRPVPEVAIVAAIGLLSGVCGRAWTIPKSGLNVYLILLARSGVGKEAMQDGIAMFINAASAKRHDVAGFFDFNDYASGQALTKAVAANPCFVHVAGEFGRKLKRMSNRNDSALQELRTVMTKLYSKSGPHAIVGGITYSDKDKNVGSVSGVAFSMIGESTPGTFREALTEDMMEDGFLSRFTVVEYEGDRPPENSNQLQVLPDTWVTWFVELVTHAQTLSQRGGHLDVQREQHAEVLLQDFNLDCDRNINSAGDDNSRRQMWNRAHLKALRVAALLAVADNYLHPCITTAHAEWAIDLIRRDIAVFTKRIDSGDIGDDDKAREAKLLAIMKDYLLEPPSPGYKVPLDLPKNSIIQRKYLQRRTSSLPAFKAHKMGATMALDQALRSLCSSGFIMKCEKMKMVEAYREHGECYRILDLPHIK
jgi:hypothetical protein